MRQRSLPQTQRQLTQVWGSIFLGEWRQDLIDLCLTNVYQHISIRAKRIRYRVPIPLSLRDNHLQRFSPIISLQNLLAHHRCHAVVVELEPQAVLVRFDESNAFPRFSGTGVNDDTVEFVLPGFMPVSRLVEEFVEVNFGGELKPIVDL
jgi:hypothetical protein